MKTLIKAKNLYSFDIFDTLISRRVGIPTGIFALIQEKIQSDSALPQKLRDNFYNIRIDAERFVRDTANKSGRSIDILFEEIYYYIRKQFDLSIQTTEYLIKLEIDTEKENLVPINENIDKLKELVNRGERVVLISDMYFSSKTLHELLSNIDSVFNDIKIYVSSEQQSAKWDGSLYKTVYEAEGIKFKNWEHLGDNVKSDYKNARKFGIHSKLFNYPKLLHYEKELLSEYPQNPEYQLLTGASRLTRLNNKISKNRDKYEFGASLAGPMLFNYINNIIDEALKRGFKTLHFIARDGHIPIIIANAIIKARKLDINTKYIYSSRLVWRIPGEKSYDLFVSSIMQEFVQKMTLSFLAKRFNVNCEVLNERFFHYKNTDKVLTDSERTEVQSILVNNPEVKKYIIDCNKDALDLTLDYIKQEFDLSSDTIALVDINGTGRTNDILACNINQIKPCKLHTFFFSFYSADSVFDTEFSKKSAYLTRTKPYYYYLELLFRAPYGQTIGYKKEENGKIKPILEECYSDALYKWGFKEYLQGISDFTDNIIKVRSHINNVEFCYYYFDYITTKIEPDTAAILGDIPFMKIGKEGNKIAGPQISAFQMILSILKRTDISTLSECAHLSLARRKGFAGSMGKFLAGFLNQLPIISELKLYFRLRSLNKQNKKVMLWGASLFLDEFIKKYKICYPNITGIIDKNPKRRGTKWGGYTVFGPDDIKYNKPDYILLTIKNKNQEIFNDVKNYIRDNCPDTEIGPNVFR